MTPELDVTNSLAYRVLNAHYEQLKREHQEALALLRSAESELDPPVCRLQFPDGTVPANAREAAEGWKRWHDEKAAQARVEADDDERASPDWIEKAFDIGDSFTSFRDQKRYEFCEGVRVIFSACQWPEKWHGVLWICKVQRDNPTRGDVRRLCKLLGLKP